MFAHRIEGQNINVYGLFHLFEKPAGRAHLLDNEMADAQNDRLVTGRQDVV